MSEIGFLFDLDGTLINSLESVDRAWVATAKEAGFGASYSSVEPKQMPSTTQSACLVAKLWILKVLSQIQVHMNFLQS